MIYRTYQEEQSGASIMITETFLSVLRKDATQVCIYNSIYILFVLSVEDIFEKAKFLASLWASTDKEFKAIPFSLIISNWKDVGR